MQYFLILSRALWGDVDVRKAIILDAEGVDGAVSGYAHTIRYSIRCARHIIQAGCWQK